jgi:hypothetical protein
MAVGLERVWSRWATEWGNCTNLIRGLDDFTGIFFLYFISAKGDQAGT